MKKPKNITTNSELSIGDELCTRLQGQISMVDDQIIANLTEYDLAQLLTYCVGHWKNMSCPMHKIKFQFDLSGPSCPVGCDEGMNCVPEFIHDCDHKFIPTVDGHPLRIHKICTKCGVEYYGKISEA